MSPTTIKSLRRIAILWFFLVTEVAQSQGTTEWEMHVTPDGAHPNGQEQELLWLLNRARSNPIAEGNFLAATGDAATVQAIAQFGVDLNRMKSEFNATPAVGPAAFDRRLYAASRQQSLYMISVDAQTHEDQIERVVVAGFDYSAIMLSVFAYADTPLNAHSSLNIDIGGPPSEGGMQEGRGHRAAIMSSNPNLPLLSNVGLALVPENNGTTGVGPLVFSGAYAAQLENSPTSFNRFVVGTVWTDKNLNRRYDAGEGLGGVRVQPDSGSYHAITGIAGGYAIPITSAGAYNLTLSGGEISSTYRLRVIVEATSVLADAETSSLAPVATSFIATITRNASGGFTLNWSGAKPPYQVQMTHALTEGWQNFGDATDQTSVAIPPQGSAAFFRVLGTE